MFKSRTPTTFLRAVERWANEGGRYNGKVIRDRQEGGQIDKNSDRFGHYTRIIWPSTREVGIGMARREDGRLLWLRGMNQLGIGLDTVLGIIASHKIWLSR